MSNPLISRKATKQTTHIDILVLILVIFQLVSIFVVFFALTFFPCTAHSETTYDDYFSKVCKKNCADPSLLRMAIQASAEENNLDPALLFSIVQVESGFKPNAINRVSGKSIGLMQIQIRWHRNRFTTKNYFDVFANTRAGGQILSECFKKHHGNRARALWCYNGHQKHGINRYALKVEKIYQHIKQKEFFS